MAPHMRATARFFAKAEAAAEATQAATGGATELPITRAATRRLAGSHADDGHPCRVASSRVENGTQLSMPASSFGLVA
jgi:hypothetical protein